MRACDRHGWFLIAGARVLQLYGNSNGVGGSGKLGDQQAMQCSRVLGALGDGEVCTIVNRAGNVQPSSKSWSVYIILQVLLLCGWAGGVVVKLQKARCMYMYVVFVLFVYAW